MLGALSNRTVDYRDFMARYRSAWTVDRRQRANNPSCLGDRALVAISLDLAFAETCEVEEEPLRLTCQQGWRGAVSIDQLSDGERSFLALICDLGRRLALANPDDLEDPLHGAGVVLIDELELHLHPTWQREVIEKLRTTFPNIQFIAHHAFALRHSVAASRGS